MERGRTGEVVTRAEGVLECLMMTGEGGSGGDGGAYFDVLGSGVCGRELWDEDGIDWGVACLASFEISYLSESGVVVELGEAS